MTGDLEEYHDIRIATETLRQWMIADGQKEEELVRSAKSKREKRIVADRFAHRLPPPGP